MADFFFPRVPVQRAGAHDTPGVGSGRVDVFWPDDAQRRLFEGHAGDGWPEGS